MSRYRVETEYISWHTEWRHIPWHQILKSSPITSNGIKLQIEWCHTYQTLSIRVNVVLDLLEVAYLEIRMSKLHICQFCVIGWPRIMIHSSSGSWRYQCILIVINNLQALIRCMHRCLHPLLLEYLT